jgi:hypothetical protein
MGFMNMFSRTDDTGHLVRLPSGTFTIDADGQVIASTLPQSFPEPHVQEIATLVLNTFKNAKSAQMPLTDLVINCAALKITARELRGGAIIFLAPELTK